MNIELLHKVQESIADETNEFYWFDWDMCIFGHMRKALGKTSAECSYADLVKIAGLDHTEAYVLAYGYTPDSMNDRKLAINTINRVIREHQKWESLDQEYEKYKERKRQTELVTA